MIRTRFYKRCGTCKAIKLLSEFSKNKNNKGGYLHQCKLCEKQWREDNKEHIKQYGKQYREDNKEHCKQYREDNKEHCKQRKKRYALAHKEEITKRQKQWREDNKEILKQKRNIYALAHKEHKKQYYEDNKEKTAVHRKQYRVSNREKRKQYENQRRKTDPNFQLACNLRTRIYNALQRQSADKLGHYHELLGCSLEECMEHLEKQFIGRMSWNNQGKWHIDHIVPVASFDLTDTEQQRTCFHYTNLQPLWAEDNLSKGSKILS